MDNSGLILGKPRLGKFPSSSRPLKSPRLRQGSQEVFLHWLLALARLLSPLKPDNLVSAIPALLESSSPSKTLFLLKPADTFRLVKVIPLWSLTLLSSCCFLAPSPLGHRNSFVPSLFHLSECYFSATSRAFLLPLAP